MPPKSQCKFSLLPSIHFILFGWIWQISRTFQDQWLFSRTFLPGLESPGKCHNKIPGLSRFSRTGTNPGYMQFVSLSSNHALKDSSTLQALHEHACLFYEKCNVDRVCKMPSNITAWSDLSSFLSLIMNYISISLHRGRGRGVRD